MDGREHNVEPNHLNPAVFDCNAVVILGFKSSSDVHGWWNSDEVFEILKWRSCMEKIGLFLIDGLQESCDFTDRQRAAFGDRIMLLELIKMESFKPMQQYVDSYKRFAEAAGTDLGQKCNLYFAEGVSGVLMNEFPLEAACASSWRSKAEVNVWYDSEMYQNLLLPQRSQFSRCFAVVLPIFEEKLEELGKATTSQAISVKLR